MTKHLLLAFLLSATTTSAYAGTFLDELPQNHTISAPVQWQPSPYDEDTTPIQTQFSGDECTERTQDSFDAKNPTQKSSDVKCYITQFPSKGIETHVQSNENGEISAGFKWEID
ncbi:hypothetical protein [Vibrio europaeus]|uniref:hypothetical protein n=1 Tax=Vibrio europaeus TaxID=300876 RepID=UPI00233E7187|nr:hypothetical protein [Vibrio europaeus]MDC5849599.1 hypothetical protein [Vibrio europaeus]MDC5856605.1 hypothetical protein [Vibrio europaeus]